MSDDNLTVKFGARTDEFVTGVSNAMRPVEDFAARVRDLNKQLSALDAPMKEVASGAGAAAASTDKLNFATAGATREFIVIGHEIMTGNFSRIPGSMMVLAERTGGLHTVLQQITPAAIAWTVAIGVAIGATYEWIAATEELAEAQATIRGAMELNNQSASYNAEVVEQNIDRLRVLAGVSNSTATEIVTSFARAGDLSEDLKQRLILMVGDYAAATGKDAPKAAQDLIKMFSDPVKGAKELADTYRSLLTPAQYEEIEAMGKTGSSSQQMANVLLNDVGPKLDGFRDKSLGPLQRGWEALGFAIKVATAGDIGRVNTLLDPKNLPAAEPSAAAEEQEHQNDNMDVEKRGLEILKTVHGENEKINALIEKRAALVRAANAAMERGDDRLANKFQTGAGDVGDEIDKQKSRQTAPEDRAQAAAERERARAEAAAQRESTQLAKAAQREREQMSRQQVSYEQQMGRLTLDNEKAVLDQKVALGEITSKEKLAQLRRLADQQYALENRALLDESRLGGLSQADRQRVNNQMLLLHQRYLNQKAALTRQASLEERRQFEQVFQGVDRAFTQSINGILQGTQTWKQAVSGIFTGVLSVFVDMAEKMASKWIESMLMQAIYGKTEAMAQIGASAAEAGAAAYASTAAIPVVGPGLAPAAAAAAYTNTMSFAGLASFAVGSWDLPGDQIAQVHQGEMIIPRTFADGIRENGGMGGGSNVTIHLNAIDSRSGAQFLKDHAGVIAKEINNQMRNANPHLTGGKF